MSPATKPFSGTHSPRKRSPSASLEISISPRAFYAVAFLFHLSVVLKPSAISASSRNLLLSDASARLSFQSPWVAFLLKLRRGAIHSSSLLYVFFLSLAFLPSLVI